jgi:hypothetical protein
MRRASNIESGIAEHGPIRYSRRRFATAIGWVAAILVSLACAERLETTGKLSVAVLGDSDSHSYQDSLLLHEPGMRGGAYRATTLQWTDIWARLRPHEVDLGRWGIWGSRLKVARLLRALGANPRAPRKMDHEFNFAMSGARCAELLDDGFPQAPALLNLMNRSPRRWANGVVIIRMGINGVGLTPQLEEYASSGLTPAVRQRVAACVTSVDRASRLIRSKHPTTKLVIVSISDDRNVASNLERWRDRAALENIESVLAHFDEGLRGLAQDSNTIFLDERDWFRRQWGGRTPDGMPDYRTMSFGGRESVSNSIGDHPRHLTLTDGHAGTVSNGMWLVNLVDLLNQRWNIGLTPITESEIARLADPDGRYGIRPVSFTP